MNILTIFTTFKTLLVTAKIQKPANRDILIVEDIANDAELIQSIVRNQGYTPHVRTSLNGALLALNSRPWHKILVDLNLGRSVIQDGMEIMEGTIFAEEAMRVNPKVKIIFVTGNASKLDGNRSTAKFPCIIKGSDFTQLDNSLSSVLSNGEHAAELRLWRLFWFVIALCSLSVGVGYVIGKYDLLKP